MSIAVPISILSGESVVLLVTNALRWFLTDVPIGQDQYYPTHIKHSLLVVSVLSRLLPWLSQSLSLKKKKV